MDQNAGQKQNLRLLFWESTIRCNLSCAHCRRVETDEASGSDLPVDAAKKLIEAVAGIGRAQNFMPILVFSGGEPLCRPDIFELMDYAVSKEVKGALATNGTLIDEEIAHRIQKVGLERISISLDGATSRVHNALRRLEGSFEAALRGIQCLRDEGTPFQINMTMTRHNVHQLDEFFALAEEVGAVAIHLFMLVPVGCGEEFAEEEMLSAGEYEQLLMQIARKEHNSRLEVKVTCGPHYERVIRELKLFDVLTDQPSDQSAGFRLGFISKGCLAGSGVLFVGHSGDVFPCGYLPVHCGNILQMPLEKIWTASEDLAAMRKADQLKGKCGVCGYRRVCGGCRARAFAATGDYMAEEPMCLYNPPQWSQNSANE